MVPPEMVKPVYEAAKRAGVGIVVYNDNTKEMISGNGLNHLFPLL